MERSSLKVYMKVECVRYVVLQSVLLSLKIENHLPTFGSNQHWTAPVLGLLEAILAIELWRNETPPSWSNLTYLLGESRNTPAQCMAAELLVCALHAFSTASHSEDVLVPRRDSRLNITTLLAALLSLIHSPTYRINCIQCLSQGLLLEEFN